jgi:hypothetical protein
MLGVQRSIRAGLCVCAPMTYLDNGKQYVVVAVGGRDYPAEWIALGLPS